MAPSNRQGNPTQEHLCPHCHSPQTSKLSVIYETGTAESYVEGSYWDLQHSGRYKGHTQSQTLLAQKATPPKRKKLEFRQTWVWLLLMILGLVALYILGGFTHNYNWFGSTIINALLDWIILGWIIFTVVGFIWRIIKEIKEQRHYNLHIFPKLKSQWERTYVCLHCGEFFENN